MNAYIWTGDKVHHTYNSNGFIVVLANNLEEAWEVLKGIVTDKDIEVSQAEFDKSNKYDGYGMPNDLVGIQPDKVVPIYDEPIVLAYSYGDDG